MTPTDNIITLQNVRRFGRQEIIDDIGARAFLMIRDEAEACNVPIKDVLMEHVLGISLVIAAVDGETEALRILEQISQQIRSPANVAGN